MNAAIGKLLTQFDANGRAKSPPLPPPPKIQDVLTRPREVRREPQPQPEAHSQPQPLLQSPPPAPKTEAPAVNLLDDAYRRGHAAGVAESDARIAEERVRSAIRLGEERAKWSDQQAVTIVSGFEAACREIETNIASSVARILLPFLADAVRDKAIGSLVEQIAALTGNSPVPVFKGHRPERTARPGEDPTPDGPANGHRVRGRRCFRGPRRSRPDRDRDADHGLERTPERGAPVARHE
ncbi:hypothetical protein ACVWW2_007082 [Bradyrhizobium sp. LM4.3]